MNENPSSTSNVTKNDKGEEVIIYEPAFSAFYQPMKKVPVIGTHYARIVPILIALVGIASLFSFSKNLVSKASKVQFNKFKNSVEIGASNVNKEKLLKGEKAIKSEHDKRKRKEMQESFKANSSMSQRENEQDTKDVELSQKEVEDEEEPVSDVLNIGHLSFKGKFGKYNKRYIVLNTSHILIYKDNSLSNLVDNYHNTTIIEATIEKKKKDNFVNLSLKEKSLKLKAESEEEAINWEKWFNHAKQLSEINAGL